ncbi:MAG: class II fructose-bisphosphatase [Actinomycetota bacterium]|nr:class II fructose-bisphosphatase [Actinomycetota bacterium]
MPEASPGGGSQGTEAYGADSVALHLLGATQAAALACIPWVGRGDKEAADGAAVAAMREILGTVPGRGRVVIGEGEKDEAPMLYSGEEVGDGHGPAFELAIDPLEGTDYCASGLDGAISVLAAGPPDALWATSGYYMDKLIVGPGARGTIDVNAPVDHNLDRVAEALGKDVSDLVVVVLDKPRHEEVIAHIREKGAGVLAVPAGDVMGSLRVLVPNGGADLALGVGGTPEGVITACVTRLLGGDMQAKLAPQSGKERAGLEAEDADLDRVLSVEDLVRSGDCTFIATGITSNPLLPAPEQTPWGWRTHSFVVTPRHPGLVVEALPTTAGP